MAHADTDRQRDSTFTESDIPAAHHGIRARYVCLAGNIAIPDFLPSA